MLNSDVHGVVALEVEQDDMAAKDVIADTITPNYLSLIINKLASNSITVVLGRFLFALYGNKFAID